MKRILIVIPVYQYVEPQCIESVINLTCVLKNKYDFQIKFITGYAIDSARNEALKYFLSTSCDYLFFVDGDIIVNESSFEKLMEADKDVVSGVYNKKSILTKETTIFIVDENKNFVCLNSDQIKPELFKIMSCGFGFVLLKRDVVRKVYEATNGFPFKYVTGNPVVSEDIFFCNELDKLGIEVWCEGNAKVGHIGKFIY